MGEILIQCKRKRKFLVITNTEYCSDTETQREFVEKEAVIEHDGDDVRKILADMHAFDILLNEDIKAFETSG